MRMPRTLPPLRIPVFLQASVCIGLYCNKSCTDGFCSNTSISPHFVLETVERTTLLTLGWPCTKARPVCLHHGIPQSSVPDSNWTFAKWVIQTVLFLHGWVTRGHFPQSACLLGTRQRLIGKKKKKCHSVLSLCSLVPSGGLTLICIHALVPHKWLGVGQKTLHVIYKLSLSHVRKSEVKHKTKAMH